MGASTFKQDEAAAYSERARIWLTRGDGLRPVSERMFPHLHLQPGQVVVDMACGPGWTALELARRVRPDGLVIAADIAEGMVQVAAEQAAHHALDNIACAVMDAEAPALPPASADALLCRFGLIHFPHPDRALRAWYDLLRPGGRVVVSVWGARERVRPLGIIVECIEQIAPHLLRDEGPLWFSFGAPGALAGAFRRAGFVPLGEEHIPLPRRFASVEAFWETQTAYSGRLALLLNQLTPREYAAVRACACAKARTYCARDGTLVLPMDAVVGWARKP